MPNNELLLSNNERNGCGCGSAHKYRFQLNNCSLHCIYNGVDFIFRNELAPNAWTARDKRKSILILVLHIYKPERFD